MGLEFDVLGPPNRLGTTTSRFVKTLLGTSQIFKCVNNEFSYLESTWHSIHFLSTQFLNHRDPVFFFSSVISYCSKWLWWLQLERWHHLTCLWDSFSIKVLPSVPLLYLGWSKTNSKIIIISIHPYFKTWSDCMYSLKVTVGLYENSIPLENPWKR